MEKRACEWKPQARWLRLSLYEGVFLCGYVFYLKPFLRRCEQTGALMVKRRHVIGHREHGLRPAVRGRTRAASPQGAGPDKARAPAVHSNSMVYPRRPTQVAAGNLV